MLHIKNESGSIITSILLKDNNVILDLLISVFLVIFLFSTLIILRVKLGALLININNV